MAQGGLNQHQGQAEEGEEGEQYQGQGCLHGVLANLMGAGRFVLQNRIKEIIVKTERIIEALEPAIRILLEAAVAHLHDAKPLGAKSFLK